MIRDFLGEADFPAVSRKLIGHEVLEYDTDALFEKPIINGSSVYLLQDIKRVFDIAENIAKLVKHKQIGCAELFVAVLMLKSNTRINDVINNHGIDKSKAQRMFLESNLSKYDSGPPTEPLSFQHDFFSLN